ncbi:TIGR00341 family protein [Dyella koreensis]|uniref:TIGR00341 family protein n=1 Tax=Dyella koreensis TaxID=311235 RepID=A0ABW8K7M8_9GAMM
MNKVTDAPSHRSAQRARWFWHGRRSRIVRGVDHAAVMSNVMDGGMLTPRYAFMAVMSCGIAILGLLQSSAAVVIGAMLISPLMGPIVQLGFSLCVVDFRMMRQALVALMAGVAMALLMAMCIVWLSPLKEATSEILARTQPTLFDLLVAVFSGLAGGYAVITRKGEAIVGVAIATALMPPLAVVGYGLAVGDTHIAGGAFFLFMTNLLAIALSVTLIAKWYGFGIDNSPQHTVWQAGVIVVTFVLLAIPLGLALRNIAQSTWTANLARAEIQAYLDQQHGSIERLKVESHDQQVAVNLMAMVPEYVHGAQEALKARLEQRLKQEVTIQFRQTLEANDRLLRDRSSLDELRAHVADLDGQLAQMKMQAGMDVASRIHDLLYRQLGEVSIDVLEHKVVVHLAQGTHLDEAGIQALDSALEQVEPGWQIEVLSAPIGHDTVNSEGAPLESTGSEPSRAP